MANVNLLRSNNSNRNIMEYNLQKTINEWNVKALSTFKFRHYSPEKELICPEKPKTLELQEDKTEINILRTMEDHWKMNNKEAMKYIAKTVSLTTAKYKATICKLTTRMTIALVDLESELQGENKKNLDKILKWQVAWNNEIDCWAHGIAESSRIIQQNIRKYIPNYQKKLMKVGFLKLDDMNSILNRFVYHINQIIVGNLQRVAHVELNLKLVYDSIIKEEVVQVYYKALLESKYFPPEQEKVDTSSENQEDWCKQRIYEDFLEILKINEEILPQFKKISELSIFITNLELCSNQVYKYGKYNVELIYKEIAKLNSKSELDLYDKEDMKMWSNFLSLAKSSLILSNNLVTNGISMWNQTISRMELVKVLIKVAVDQRKLINLFNEEVSINILMDRLRECPELKLISVIFQKINAILNHYEKRIHNATKDELKIIDSSIRSLTVCSDVFESSRLFLTDHYNISETMLNDEANATVPQSSYNLLINSVIQKLIMHETSAKVWRKAFCDNLRITSNEMKKVIPMMTDEWTCGLKIEVMEWNERYLKSVRCRRQRIITDIVDVRAAELEEHSLRLKRHIAGFYKECAELAKVENVKYNMICLNYELENKLRSLMVVNLLNVRRINEQITKIKRSKTENQAKRSYLIKREIQNVERKFYWMTVNNKHFLKSIKFFGENGNFSPQEAQKLVIAIQRLERNMPAQKNLIIKTIKEVANTYKPEKTLEGDLFKKMQLKNAEINFKEFLVTELYEIYGVLRRESNYLIASIRLLEEYVRKMTRWKPAPIERYINRLKEFSTYLVIPDVTEKLEIEVPEPKPEKKPKGKGKKEPKAAQDYVNKLLKGTKFQSKEKQCCYLFNIKFLLYESISKIQKNARVYFGKAKSLKKKKKEPGTEGHADPTQLYKDMMESLLTAFKGYNLQCERFWLECMLDFIGLVNLLRSKFKNFAKKSVNSVTDWWKLKLNKLSKSYIDDTEVLCQTELDERMAIANELKPWHGFPEKKPLLVALNTKMAEHCRTYVKQMASDFYEYKLRLRAGLQQHNPTSLKLHNLLQDLKYIIFRLQGLEIFFYKFAAFIDRYTTAYFESQILLEPGDEESEEPLVDYLLEPGGINKLVKFPANHVLVISEGGLLKNQPEDNRTSGDSELSQKPTIDSHLTDPVYVSVNGFIIKTGLSPTFELINVVACIFQTIYLGEMKFKPSEDYNLEPLCSRADADLRKLFNNQKKILKYKCSVNIITYRKELEAWIKQLEMWHIRWLHDIAQISKLYVIEPFYSNNKNSLTEKKTPNINPK